MLERAGAVVRDNAEAHFNLGIAYVLLRNGPGAARELSILARLSPPLASQLRGFMREQPVDPHQ